MVANVNVGHRGSAFTLLQTVRKHEYFSASCDRAHPRWITLKVNQKD